MEIIIKQKRHERLGCPITQSRIEISLSSLNISLTLNPKSEFEIAWKKYNQAADRSLLAILYYLVEEDDNARKHASEFFIAANELLFGSWRSEFTKPEKTTDAAYWKHSFNWMQIFEAALLWGSVLGEWEFLKKLAAFPQPDSCISSGYGSQGRDLYVALGAFLREAPKAELDTLLVRASAGPKKFCKLSAAVIRACIARDAAMIEKTLTDFLKYYKKREFPKEDITKKVSSEGTFFVHWAEKEKLAITVPPEFADYIVRLNPDVIR
jgi:hypothetical protein